MDGNESMCLIIIDLLIKQCSWNTVNWNTNYTIMSIEKFHITKENIWKCG